MKNNSKNTKRNNGMVLILVITTIGLAGVVMLFLASASNTMRLQANDVYLQACERNLTSSGLNWARTNIKNGTISDFNDTIQLDVNDMNTRSFSLELKINSPKNGQNNVEIKTRFESPAQNRTKQTTFFIDGSH